MKRDLTFKRVRDILEKDYYSEDGLAKAVKEIEKDLDKDHARYVIAYLFWQLVLCKKVELDVVSYKVDENDDFEEQGRISFKPGKHFHNASENLMSAWMGDGNTELQIDISHRGLS